MISLRHILGLCPLCVLQVAVGQAEVGDSPEAICSRLLESTREVDRLLRTVSDQESGKRVASKLKSLLVYMHHETGRLSQLPITTPEQARVLERSMRDLMHITQGYMPVVQRLEEVNAYGAEELMQLFRFYKMTAPSPLADERREETPLVRSYGEWCDSMDDVIYLLRRVSDAASAAVVVADLPTVVQRMNERAAQVERLQSGMTPHQLDAERTPLDRLMRLKTELRAEALRLLEAGGYGNQGLILLLKHCVEVEQG